MKIMKRNKPYACKAAMNAVGRGIYGNLFRNVGFLCVLTRLVRQGYEEGGE